MTPEEITSARTGTRVSHCPAPAVLGGFPILDIKWMQEQGIVVSLGCDGSATNDSSNLLDTLENGLSYAGLPYKAGVAVSLPMIC